MTSFERYYAAVPAEQRERLAVFRATHPAQRITLNGAPWEYIACGSGEHTILWLVGGLRVADAAYRSIPLLEDGFRIIAPTYPPLHTMSALCDGLAALLDANGVERAHILSGSFGGMVAQAFVRRHPSRADRVVLSTTTALDAQAAERYRQQAAMIAAAPPELATESSKAYFVQMIAPPDDERAFWTAYVDELFSERLTQDDLLSTVVCMLDFAENVSLAPDDLAGWPGRMLIIESQDDATFDADARARLRALYPGARVHTFAAGGHSPATTQRETFFALVRQFFAQM
jgi:lipase